MAKIDELVEQTSFLLDKQKETKEFFENSLALFLDLFGSEQDKAEGLKKVELLECFQRVRLLLEKLDGKALEQLEEDIVFLEEQLGAIKQIQNMPDEKKVAQLGSLLIEDDSKVTDTKVFKKTIEQEAEQAQQEFQVMIDDIKSVLLEDGVQELEILLEAHLSTEENRSEEEEEEDLCSDCSSACSGGGCNIFKDFEIEKKKK